MFSGVFNEVGSLPIDGRIVTRAGYSSQEIKDKENEYYKKFYSIYYNELVNAYKEAGYGKCYRGFFGLMKNCIDMPYDEIRVQARDLARQQAKKVVENEVAEIERIERESRALQKWQHIQATRSQSASLSPTSFVSVGGRKGLSRVLVTKLKGEQTIVRK